MKRVLIASAVAAVAFSGTVLAQGSNLPTLYGNIQFAVVHDYIDGGPSSVDLIDNGTTVGILHDHELAPGITGFFRLEVDRLFANDITSYESDDDDRFRVEHGYIGVRSDNFGAVWAGTDDSAYEAAVAEISEFFEIQALRLVPAYDTGQSNLLQYRSPSFNGLTLSGAVQFNGDSTSVRYPDGSWGTKKSYPWQLAVQYDIDNLELAFAVDSNDGGNLYNSRDASPNNENTYGFRVSYTLDNLRLTGEYHTRKDVNDTFALLGVYTLGANQFALAYEHQKNDFGAKLKRDTITFQALHNVSDSLYVYIEGYLGGGDDVYGYNANDEGEYTAFSDERSVAAIGATYYF